MRPHCPYVYDIRLDDSNTDLKSELSSNSPRFLFSCALGTFISQYTNKYMQMLIIVR